MSKKSKIIIGIVSAIIAVALIGGYYFVIDVKGKVGKISTGDFLKEGQGDSLSKEKRIIAQLDSISLENEKIQHKLTGKRVSVLITGVDSRIGYKGRRADANHLINIYLDSAFIEIISIPRATETRRPHYLANLRAIEGEASYMREVCHIAGVDKIDYHVEFGLSQAIGLLELLGYKKNAVQILRTLRSRKTFGPGDYQRSYNQGQFIRQMILKLMPHMDEFNFEVIIRGGLMLVETDIDITTVNKIVKELKSKGFPKSEKDVIVTPKPYIGHKLKVFNFANEDSVNALYKYVGNRSKNPIVAEDTIRDGKLYDNGMVSRRVTKMLNFKVKSAKESLKSNPKFVIFKLETPVIQRAWHQIVNKKERAKVRKSMCELLAQAYEKNNQIAEAKKVKRILDSEIQIEELLKEKTDAEDEKTDTLKAKPKNKPIAKSKPKTKSNSN